MLVFSGQTMKFFDECHHNVIGGMAYIQVLLTVMTAFSGNVIRADVPDSVVSTKLRDKLRHPFYRIHSAWDL